jgi:Pan3 Pseudokinase domain
MCYTAVYLQVQSCCVYSVFHVTPCGVRLVTSNTTRCTCFAKCLCAPIQTLLVYTNSHLHNEYDNGRILRLLLKLNAINERPEHHGSATWSETGDRYLLMLFRDYCFHQVSICI